ncbi:MAG: HigA family addiction module antitoxin [Treponema sp.]|nr:HigA family addiction module antitoxin [Treponema sp.]
MNNIQMANEYTPDYIVTPGEVLEDYLEYTGLSQASLAERTGLSKKTINEIIKAKSAITAETALKFERTLGRPAHFWSNLERQYQEDKTRLADKIRLEEDLHWLEIFPFKEMVKYGWIESHKEKIKQLASLLQYFAVASPAQWETIWNRELQTAFRKKDNTQKDIALVSAWLRKGEIESQKIQCSKYDKQKFQNSLIEIRKLTLEDKNPGVFARKLEALCASAGVAIVFIPALPKLGIYGATRWFNDKYIIQLSLYGKSNDQMWFTIFHEACHIINHSRNELYIEEKGLENEKEKEADIFASNFLIPPNELSNFLAYKTTITLTSIKRFASSIGIAPGIVAGRLQHDKKLPMSFGNDLKVRYEWTEKEKKS